MMLIDNIINGAAMVSMFVLISVAAADHQWATVCAAGVAVTALGQAILLRLKIMDQGAPE